MADQAVADEVQMMLTTVDNPFDPFTQYNEWRVWDEEHKYFSNSLLARVTRTSDDLSEADQKVALHDAIKEIVRWNVSGMHKAVTKTV